ncbi:MULTISPECIES: prolyl aminopeptidase [unclassified Lentimicrobium]|uniref:prolyl aminopeptidase n=1 Tax=unclassified Lentimicrobium TaxID=2677434 RepID=UPI0015575E7C|nr:MULTISPECIES: prolyl aminopeptidase [unclassified Lentimicrobium]NPD45669.1 prolyl aminopeptidase [Lentimicrobium sp. S6]NPD85548.1 prolyl aminopeptidase [Lentimicrobium sp. L6]
MTTQKNDQAYKQGYLEISNNHSLYFELYGNPKGIPVLFLHGGPGAGFSDKDKKFFNKKRYNVIFFDQRGTSRSKPFGSVENNTTQDLIGDINTILDDLGFDKVYVFGGSWGSTLALVYAIHSPERVLGLVLRGIWLANKYALDHYINGGIKEFFPDVWDRFAKLVPEGENPVNYYLEQMLSNNKERSDKYAYEWAYYEMSFYTINKIADPKDSLNTLSFKSMAILEAYYIKNNCFIPEDYIMDNIDKIAHIKTSIVQGRYDFICPPTQAFRLHSKLNNSKLNITNAGHSSSDIETKKNLISELKRITTTTKKA